MDMLNLTGSPIHLSGAAAQPLYLGLDVSAYEALDFLLVIPSAEYPSPSSPPNIPTSVRINIRTGMQLETEDGWVNLVSFPASFFTPSYSWKESVRGGFMRYVRWNVVSTSTLVGLTFWIMVMGRRS